MANIIDALFITLGLQTDGFKKGSKEVQDSLEKTGKTADKTGQDLADAMDRKATAAMIRFKNEALAVTAILVGATGLKDWVENTVKANVATGNLSKNIGLSSNQLNGWRNAAEHAGGSADDMQNALVSMSNALETFKLRGTITGPLIWFKYLNLSATDAQGKIIGVEEAMKRVATAMQGKGRQEQAYALSQMGFGSGVIPLLTKGGNEVQALVTDMRRIGDTTGNLAESSERLNAAWVDLKTNVGSTASELENKLEPAMVKVLQTALGISQAVKSVVEGKDRDPTIVRQQQNAVRSENAWLWNLLFGPSQKPEAISGKVIDESASLPSVVKTDGAVRFSGVDKKYRLWPGLINALFMQESGGGKHVLGPMTKYGRAKGPFQFMDDTARAYHVKNPFDVNESADAAGHMMRDLLDHYGGDLQKALAAYNWGAGNLDKFGLAAMPTETRKYTSSVMGSLGIGGAGTSITNETHIGQITINSKATDANGIARDIKGAIQTHALVAQADSGMR